MVRWNNGARLDRASAGPSDSSTVKAALIRTSDERLRAGRVRESTRTWTRSANMIIWSNLCVGSLPVFYVTAVSRLCNNQP